MGLVGAAIIAAGIAHGIKGYKATYKKYMHFGEALRRWAHPVCRFGLIARGVVFIVIGSFVLYAAWTFDPQQTVGLAGALATLRQQAYGTFLLLLVACGLIAFGVYCLLEMIYRRIQTDASGT